MTDPTFPTRVFLATDLSARCDRALARASQLATAWHSELIVAHVVDPSEVAHRDHLASSTPSWRRPETWLQSLRSTLAADLEAEGIAATTRVVIGTPAKAVQQAVADDGAGLAVLGIAKDARMDRIQLGSTADALVRQARVPVLNVRGRVRGAYHHVVVATDFSEPSLHALQLAAHWFAGARLTLFHACMLPRPGLTSGTGANDAWGDTLEQECAAHLARAGLPGPVAAALQRVIERGQQELLLPDYVGSAGVDLVVLGSQGRSGLARAVLGSTAENLLHALDCDTLVVRRG